MWQKLGLRVQQFVWEKGLKQKLASNSDVTPCITFHKYLFAKTAKTNKRKQATIIDTGVDYLHHQLLLKS